MSDAEVIARAVHRSANVAELLVGRGVLAGAAALYARHFTGPAILFADENTWAAAGQALENVLQSGGIKCQRHILPAHPRPKPSVELARDLAARMAGQPGTPVAIGSGVLNDLVKFAAFHGNRPYLCVATAASMDGYTSAGAPLSDKGFKMTIPCRPARAVLADMDVITAAPPAMTGWGYGDLAGKVPAGGDWIIADFLGIEPIDTVAWPMVQDGLSRWLGQPARIGAGDPQAVEGLFTGLTLVGLAMEAHGTSRPASGGDHQIAHLWEMEDLTLGGERVSHGACVAVGCMATLRMYDWFLTQDLARIDPAALAARAPTMAQKAAEILAAIGPGEIATRATVETRAKHPEPATLQARLERLRDGWPQLRRVLRGRLTEAPTMQRMLRAAGAPTECTDIGVTRDRLRTTILTAGFLRSRYTLLDLLAETGLLAEAAEHGLPPILQAEREAG